MKKELQYDTFAAMTPTDRKAAFHEKNNMFRDMILEAQTHFSTTDHAPEKKAEAALILDVATCLLTLSEEAVQTMKLFPVALMLVAIVRVLMENPFSLEGRLIAALQAFLPEAGAANPILDELEAKMAELLKASKPDPDIANGKSEELLKEAERKATSTL